jgi:hypothetical protein
VAWCWANGAARHLVVVNLGDGAAQGRVRLPWADLAGRGWELADRLGGECFQRDGDELARDGLYVDLAGWGAHFLAWAAHAG